MAFENPALTAESFNRGSAQAAPAERVGMTATGTYVKTFFLLVLVGVAAAFGWSQTEIVVISNRAMAIAPPWTWLAFFLTFILAFAGIFSYRSIPIIAPLYALSEGTLLGIASRYYELEFEGIVTQAVLTTLAIFTAVLILYSLGIIKVTPTFAMGVGIAMGGLLILYLTAWLFSIFGMTFRFLYAPTPLGLLVSLGIVILGALTLPLDFEFIRDAENGRVPKFMEWYGAYGLMLSLIWMYVSILRLLALLKAAQ